MLNSMSMDSLEENQVTVATDISNVTSLKKLKQGFQSNKDIRANKKLVYEKKSGVINSLQ